MFVLDHHVEIRIPTQCGDCKKKLPESLRDSILVDAKRDFGKWFGGYEVTHKHGGYTFPDGTLVEEEVDVVSSNCTADALEEHLEDLAIFAVRVANELSQDSVALSIDGKMLFYDRTPGIGKCLHAKKGAAPALPLSVPEGRAPKSDLEKMQALYAALDNRKFNINSAKLIFNNLLSYDLTDETLPWRDWPKDLRDRLKDAPQVIAYERGFKIVYLHQSSGQLSRGTTRAVISRILRDNANSFYGLFIVSNDAGDEWALVNARIVDGKARRLILRSIPVGTGKGARTATDRLVLVDLDGREKQTAQQIQELHDSAFDVEGISKEFYQKIAAWYFWAQGYKGVKYPRSVITDADKSIFFIRMLTRLIFCWFMRAKGLVPEELFDLKAIKTRLKDSKKDEGIYYKAILQNLFFATLNREIKDRSFLGKNDKELDENYSITTLYHYADLMKDPDAILGLFKKIPFVNGGLFECLDDTQEIRRDDFSENGGTPLCIPDDLFFSPEREVDLSGMYGDKKYKKVSVTGLINILKHYQFTVEENTPLDQSVALDPELLGKVFENLLASYNEETKTTARKALGAFYTPREIVDYMVDESLLAYLKGKVPDVSEDQLRALLSYSDEPHGFSEDVVEKLINAIDHLKALDPAVGSGAFPMGLLHKLVHILGKLDPGNEKWKARQLAKIEDVELQKKAERVFRDNPADYGRKLHLIQHCIYGVDIQPVAVQIAKMRFFISLLVDQKQTNDLENNYGIIALPNLETNFLAANTLIGIDSSQDQNLSINKDEIARKVKELKKVRQEHFNATAPKAKAKCREKDAKLRSEISDLLKKELWDDITARQIADWNPYDQNKSSGFFDLKWMFGIEDGVDIVIGNPPYVEAKKLKYISQELRKNYKTYSGTADLYVYFYENGIRVLRQNGTLVFITSNKFVKTSYGENLRKYFINFKINEIVDFTDVRVFEALVASCIFSITKEPVNSNEISIAFANDALINFVDLSSFVKQNRFLLKQRNLTEKIWQLENETKLLLKKKIENGSITILQTGTINVYRGVTTGYNPAFIIDDDKRKELIRADKANKDIIKPMLQGRNIRKWIYNSSNEFLLQTGYDIAIKKDFPKIFEHLNHFKKELEVRADQGVNWWNLRSCKYYSEFEKEKIIWGLTSDKWTFAYDMEGNYLPSNGYILTSKEIPVKYLLALMNSKLMEFYFGFVGIMTAGGAFTLKYETVVEFPIKVIPVAKQSPFINLVDKILDTKKADPHAYTSRLEKQIDEMVYKLYDLTEEEIAIIEGKDY